MPNSDRNTAERENFLLQLLNKVMREYKALLDSIRNTKPFKIMEITHLSKMPGETEFLVQISLKNCVTKLSAKQIITEGYNLDLFNEFHASLIRKALEGKIIEFLDLTQEKPKYRIISKIYDRRVKQYLFTLTNQENITFIRTAEEISQNKKLLETVSVQDAYNVGYTQGSQSIINEKSALITAKNRAEKTL